MPIIGAGVLAFLVIFVSASFTSSTPTSEATVTGTAGQKIEGARYEYERLPRIETVIEKPKVEEVLRAAPVPRPKIERAVVIEPTPVPPPPAPTTPVPLVDPAASACLGKFVGTQCSFTKDGVEKEGTCMTPAWKPVTCVTHTP